MALKWYDGAEIYGSSSYVTRVYVSGDPAATQIESRLSPGQWSYNMASDHLTPPSLGVQNTWIVGFGLRKGSSQPFRWEFRKGATEQLRLEAVNEGGGFKFRLMRGATEVAVTTATFAYDQWHYFELKVTIRTGTNGAYELRHNEANVLSGSSVNLANVGNDGADVHSFGYTNNVGACYLDDVYICDSTGSVNNDFLGDSVVVGLLPDADGATLDWSTSTGADHYVLVDDPVTAPNNVDYVSSATNGDIDLYSFQALPSTGLGTIYGVAVSVAASLETVGSRTLRSKYRSSGGTVEDGEDFVVDGTGVVETLTIFEINPVTTNAWSATDIDTGQFGFEVVS
jgi:hypothetical protein